jgi:hypothetical protein
MCECKPRILSYSTGRHTLRRSCKETPVNILLRSDRLASRVRRFRYMINTSCSCSAPWPSHAFTAQLARLLQSRCHRYVGRGGLVLPLGLDTPPPHLPSFGINANRWPCCCEQTSHFNSATPHTFSHCPTAQPQHHHTAHTNHIHTQPWLSSASTRSSLTSAGTSSPAPSHCETRPLACSHARQRLRACIMSPHRATLARNTTLQTHMADWHSQ